MIRIVLKSKVGPDGVLQLSVPVGQAEANTEVQVTIETAPPKPTTQEEWQEFIRRTAGAWQGDFERPPQGEFEKRDEF